MAEASVSRSCRASRVGKQSDRDNFEGSLAGAVGDDVTPDVRFTVQKGRPDTVGVLGQACDAVSGGAVWVFACGPRSLTRQCWDDAVAVRSRRGTRIDFHCEEFDW